MALTSHESALKRSPTCPRSCFSTGIGLAALDEVHVSMIGSLVPMSALVIMIRPNFPVDFGYKYARRRRNCAGSSCIIYLKRSPLKKNVLLLLGSTSTDNYELGSIRKLIPNEHRWRLGSMADFYEVWRFRDSVLAKLEAMLKDQEAMGEQELKAATAIKRFYRAKVGPTWITRLLLQ